MRHAILILAHDDMASLKKLIAYFCTNCDIYIHIDKKTKCNKDEINELYKMNGVRYVSQKFKINWGSYNMLLAEIHLLNIAYAEHRATYYHLFSGHDYPLRPLQYFLEFFSHNNGMNYIYCRLADSKLIHDRLLQYHPYSLFNAKDKKRGIYIYKIVNLQRKYNIFRSMKNFPRIIAIGSQWFSITEDAVAKIVNPSKNNRKFLKRLKSTFAPEELYINTLVVNSIKNKYICCDNLRYIRWKFKNGNCPSILDLSLLKYCISSKALFARKFDTNYSAELKKFIDTNILNNSFQNIDSKNYYRYFNKFFNYDSCIAQTIKKLVEVLELKDILYVECGNCLYLDSFVGLKLPIQGISSNKISDNYASAYNLLDYYQNIDITTEIEADETFNLILLINSSVYSNLYKSKMALQNICKLTNKYILIIEEKDNLEKINELTFFVDAIISCGFKLNSLSKTIFAESTKSKIYSYSLER